MRKLILAAALGASALGGTALAGQATPDAPMPPHHGGMLRMGDMNRDGVTTRDEAIAAADARFAQLDADHDGKVTRAEIQAAMGEMMGGPPPGDASPPPPPPLGGMGRRRGMMGERMFDRADADHDGSLSRDELRAAELRRFDRLDANHDGRIDQAERDAMRDRMMRMRGMGGDQPPPPPPPPADGEMPGNGH